MTDTVVLEGEVSLVNQVDGEVELVNHVDGDPEVVVSVGGQGGGITDAVKTALLNCFQHVAWVDEDGQEYYDALYDALYAQTVVSITAVFEQGQAVIYSDDSLDDLKQYLTVTASYDDGTSAVVTGYTLSGTLTAGTSVITVTYEGKKAYFNVTVTERPALVSISAVYTQSGTVYEDTPLNDLKTDLVVTATYSDSSTATVPSADYTLSGTLTAGTSTITVSYSGKTTTFNVTVSTNMLYELPNATAFTGSNYIDTQLALMETDIDFTIMMKFVNGTPSNDARIFHCVNEAGQPYQGIQFYEKSSTLMFSGQSTTAVTLSSYPVTENTEINVCIRHEAGTTQYYLDGTVDGVRQAQYTMIKNKSAQLTNEPLYIGCAKNGTSRRYYWKGTINEFKIKGAYVSDSDVTAYLES